MLSINYFSGFHHKIKYLGEITWEKIKKNKFLLAQWYVGFLLASILPNYQMCFGWRSIESFIFHECQLGIFRSPQAWDKGCVSPGKRGYKDAFHAGLLRNTISVLWSFLTHKTVSWFKSSHYEQENKINQSTHPHTLPDTAEHLKGYVK